MQKYLEILKKSKLFHGLNNEEIFLALNCLNSKTKEVPKGTVLFSEGDKADYIGLILSGEIELQKLDFCGNANIISTIYPGEIINIAVSYSTNKIIPFDVYCNYDSKILCLDNQILIKQCRNSCMLHSKIIENMLSIIADKNVQLTNKIEILTKRTIREKVLAYLYSQSKKSKNERFSIILTRSQLANFLSVNRSALVRELSNMRKEGLIDFKDNLFWFSS